MANNQPLHWQTPIVDPVTGRPTKEFMRWAQQRLEDIDGALTPDQLDAILETITIAAGNGLSGGGNLSAGTITINVNVGTGITIDADAVTLADTAVTPATYGDATHVAQFTVDQQGRLVFVQNVAISGGAGGGYGYEASPGTVPTVAGFAAGWLNQGTSTAVDQTKGVKLKPQLNSQVHALLVAVPTAPFDCYCRVKPQMLSTAALGTTNNVIAGIVMRDSGDGELVTLETQFERTAGGIPSYAVAATTWSSATTPVTGLLKKLSEVPYNWLRVNVSTTTITFYCSVDGYLWDNVGSTLISAHIDNVNQIGIYAYGVANATEVAAIFYDFGFVAPS